MKTQILIEYNQQIKDIYQKSNAQTPKLKNFLEENQRLIYEFFFNDQIADARFQMEVDVSLKVVAHFVKLEKKIQKNERQEQKREDARKQRQAQTEERSNETFWSKVKNVGAMIVGGLMCVVGLAASGIGIITLPFGGAIPLMVGMGLIVAGSALAGFSLSNITKPVRAESTNSNKWSNTAMTVGAALFIGLGIAAICTGFGAIIGVPLLLAGLALGAGLVGAGVARREQIDASGRGRNESVAGSAVVIAGAQRELSSSQVQKTPDSEVSCGEVFTGLVSETGCTTNAFGLDPISPVDRNNSFSY